MRPQIEKVVSGGQAGVDRAAFDVALQRGIETGGWVPKNRRAEDGPIPNRYPNLKETETPSYSERTALNVRDSDATLIIYFGQLKGGSLLTKNLAQQYGKPVMLIDLRESDLAKEERRVNQWIRTAGCKVLNIAGPRASSDDTVYHTAKKFLALLLENGK